MSESYHLCCLFPVLTLSFVGLTGLPSLKNLLDLVCFAVWADDGLSLMRSRNHREVVRTPAPSLKPLSFEVIKIDKWCAEIGNEFLGYFLDAGLLHFKHYLYWTVALRL